MLDSFGPPESMDLFVKQNCSDKRVNVRTKDEGLSMQQVIPKWW